MTVPNDAPTAAQQGAHDDVPASARTGQSGATSGCPCGGSDRAETAVCVVPGPPRGTHLVHCPCCGLSGFQSDDDTTPMPCPDCLIPAVRTEEATRG